MNKIKTLTGGTRPFKTEAVRGEGKEQGERGVAIAGDLTVEDEGVDSSGPRGRGRGLRAPGGVDWKREEAWAAGWLWRW